MADAHDGARAPISQTIHDPTRRALLTSVPAAAIGTAALAGDAELVRLRRELDSVHAARLAIEASGETSEEVLKPPHEKQWQLREAIDQTAATGLAGLIVKARAMEIAVERDGEPDDDGPGAFGGLALSIIRDLKAIEARMAVCPLASLADKAEELIESSTWIDEADRKDLDSAFDHLRDDLSTLEERALGLRAHSGRGALVQFLMLMAEIETEIANANVDQDVKRSIQRGQHSLACVLEKLTGERLPECRDFYMPEEYNPFVSVEAALAEWRASKSAKSGEASSEESPEAASQEP